MIIGIGSDLVDIRRIEYLCDRFGERFIERILTEGERIAMQEYMGSEERLLGFIAKRFAAKEACAKALGCGIGSQAGWRDIEVVRLASGKPSITLHQAAHRYLADTMGGFDCVNIHLSLSDEFPYAQAFVVIEAIPAQHG